MKGVLLETCHWNIDKGAGMKTKHVRGFYLLRANFCLCFSNIDGSVSENIEKPYLNHSFSR